MQIHQLKALTDNYNFILHDPQSKKNFAIDPSGAEPIRSFLTKKNWQLDGILNTHHHPDHTDGNLALKKIYDCPIYGFAGDAPRIPGLTDRLHDQQDLKLGSFSIKVLHIPGHTLGQMAFWLPKDSVVFVGDTLFNFGCGRVFEGTYEQMFASLSILKNLPPETMVYCGHEYTLRNLEFCMTQKPNQSIFRDAMANAQKLLKTRDSTVPFKLADQVKQNPFLTENFADFSTWRDQKNAF